MARIVCEGVVNASTCFVVVMEDPRTTTVHVRSSSYFKMWNRAGGGRVTGTLSTLCVGWEGGG
eukprot:3446622-Rhodomonas_salina.1